MACKLWLFIASLKVWTFFVERAINTDKKRPNSNFSQTYLQVIGFLCVCLMLQIFWLIGRCDNGICGKHTDKKESLSFDIHAPH